MIVVIPWANVAHDNHRLMPIRMGKTARQVTAPAYREAKERAFDIARAQWRAPMIAGGVYLRARCFFPDARKRDAGNYRKLVTDAFTGVVYTDDSQLAREVWECAGIDRVNPRIEVEVAPFGDQQEALL